MLTQEFNYDLPKELIAQEPVEPRDQSRLMVVDRSKKTLEHQIFHQITKYFNPGDVLVVNNTRVMPARLYGVKAETGTKIEVLLLQPSGTQQFECLVRPGRRVKPGTKIIFGSGELIGRVVDITAHGSRIIALEYVGIFEEVLEKLGEMPLPPYITHQLKEPERYQTVYGHHWGSAAAPTAGLHFTEELLEKIKASGVEIVELLLHVGLGTFRPVEAEIIADHQMHREYYSLSAEAADCINQAKECGGRIIAVGTTSVRVLETVAQRQGTLVAQKGWTDIFIYPGYNFKIVDSLITNFHLPKSTLLMLVSAFANLELTQKAYQEAIASQYRFFSFGDGMLIL